jgi:hypothetical protein
MCPVSVPCWLSNWSYNEKGGRSLALPKEYANLIHRFCNGLAQLEWLGRAISGMAENAWKLNIVKMPALGQAFR